MTTHLNLANADVPFAKPTPPEVHRRIARACLRLERRNVEKTREKMLALLNEAVSECLTNARRQSVRDYHRQLQWTALKEGLGIAIVPSETTFRRRVKSAGAAQTAATKGGKRSIRSKELEAVVMQAVLAAFEMMPDRTIRLRRNC
ncbi:MULTISPECIES: hypothetical protein [Hyphomicrobiales]|jgi:hypothetical protein|uniref:hypothetical protein n=1 Tax=Hyphomicrobiales TaxID=356 RepID=UPI000646B812|nr:MULTISPECIES: hypothetical protein [Hyphomicrobiales]RKD74106.1 hypothetical protein BJ928_101455 [Rhizobium sp. WW_1]RZS83898.1 hypothetical protein EV217_2649 [Phyllobacterium myrsinacearum]